MKTTKLFTFLLALFFFYSCQNQETLQSNPMETNEEPVLVNKCSTIATVKDMTGLDGCGLMFELENGEKIMPETPESMPAYLRDGIKVTISYTYLEDRVSACMSGKIVSIECLEELK